MNSKILPIKEPLIQVLQCRAFPLAVTANYNETLAWFYSNFIQLKCTSNFIQKNDLQLDFIAGNVYGGIPWLDYLTNTNSDKVIINRNINDFYNFIMDSISNGFYFFTFVDEFYIPNRSAYQKNRFIHDIMIYGYDLPGRRFNIVGFNHDMDFVETEVDFESFYNGFINSDANGQTEYVILFKKKDHLKYDFKIDRFLEKLADYLYSNDCSEKLATYDFDNRTSYIEYLCRHLKTGNCVYGMKIYEQLILFCEAIGKNIVSFDIRPFHCLWEHKKCMLLRLKFMIDNNFYNDIDKIFEGYKKIELKALVIRNLMVKAEMTHNYNDIKTVITYLQELQTEEYNLLINLLTK